MRDFKNSGSSGAGPSATITGTAPWASSGNNMLNGAACEKFS